MTAGVIGKDRAFGTIKPGLPKEAIRASLRERGAVWTEKGIAEWLFDDFTPAVIAGKKSCIDALIAECAPSQRAHIREAVSGFLFVQKNTTPEFWQKMREKYPV